MDKEKLNRILYLVVAYYTEQFNICQKEVDFLLKVLFRLRSQKASIFINFQIFIN